MIHKDDATLETFLAVVIAIIVISALFFGLACLFAWLTTLVVSGFGGEAPFWPTMWAWLIALFVLRFLRGK